jgi:hypothetical protein
MECGINAALDLGLTRRAKIPSGIEMPRSINPNGTLRWPRYPYAMQSLTHARRF